MSENIALQNEEKNVIIVTFNITKADTTIVLKNLEGMTQIEWGDDSTNSDLTHTYTTIGEYICKIYNVTSIGSSAFAECYSLTSVVIGDSVTGIGNGAFAWCSSLTSVVIGDNVTSIGNGAFAWCSSLTNIVIPESVTSIMNNAFYWCSSLTEIVIPDSVTSIVDGAFQGCPITTVILPAQAITSIPNDSLQKVTITSGEEIASSAFAGCKSLESIVIPDSVTSIGDGAFRDCSGLKSITIGNGVTNITNQTFIDCQIEKATIPTQAIPAIQGNTTLHTVTITSGYEIGSSAFSGCTSLTSVEIDDSITMVDKSAFNDCPITKATIPTHAIRSIPKNSLQTVKITSSGEIGGEIGFSAFSGCTSLTSVEIDDGVTSIGNAAFYNCGSLTSVVIPNSVTSIGNSAFDGCSGLKSVVIGDSVTSIGGWAFYGCSSLTSVIVPDSVTLIGHSAFSGCKGLVKMVIPFVGDSRKTSSDINQYPFGYIFGENPYDGGVATEQLYYSSNINSTTSTTYYIPENLETVTVTDGDVLYGAFCNCSRLKCIITNGNVKNITKSAFSGCTNVEKIVVSKNVIDITEDTFNGLPSTAKIYYEGSKNAWDTARGKTATYETTQDKIEHFDLMFYPFKTVYGLNTKTEYKNSFKHTTENLEKIKADLALNKTIAHNIMIGTDDTDIACIKNYLKLKARVTTTKKVTLIEEAEILNNIYKAVYANFNARQVDFGEEIPYNTILSVLKNADYRIKEVNLDEPMLSTKFSLTNGDEVALSDVANTKDRGNTLYNKLVRRNVLAGKIAAFKYDNDFVSEYDKTSYKKTEDEDYSTAYPNEPGKKIIKIESQFDVGTAFAAAKEAEGSNFKGYVLKENEVIQFRVPNFKTTKTYPAYVNYFIKLNSTSGAGAIAATFETLGNFLEDKWESILDKDNGVAAIRNVVTQETTPIDSLEKFNEVVALHGALFTKEGEGQSTVYTKATTYTANTNYYYVPLKPLGGQQSIFWALNSWIKAQTGLHGQPLTGIYRTVGVQERPFGRLIDEAQYKYLPAYNFGNLSSDKDALNTFYVQVTHDPNSDDVKVNKKFTADGLGQDASYKGVPKDGEYRLKNREYLLINYTDSKKDEAGVERKTVVNKVYSEGDIIRANFELIDSALYHNNHSYSKKDGFSFAGQMPEGMFTLGTNEQIEIRDIVQVDLDEEGTYLYWTLNSDDPNALSNPFIFDEDYNGGTNNAYTLKEGEHLYYTNSKKQDLVYYGSGTLIVKSSPNLKLRKYTDNGEVSEEDIMTHGLAANIPWQPFTFSEDNKLTIIENQYISLTEGDIIASINGTGLDPINTIGNNWEAVTSPIETEYRLAEDEVNSHLPPIVVDGINWAVRSRLDFNMSKTTAQPLHRGDKLIVTFKDGANTVTTETLESTEAAKYAPVYVNSNYTCQAAVNTLDTTKLLEGGLELKLKVSSQMAPTISDHENLTLNNYINGEAKYTKFDFENLPAGHNVKQKAFSLNISIPETAFGLIAIYYIKGDDETSTNDAYIKAKDESDKILGLEFFNVGDYATDTKTLKAGLNIIKLSPKVKQLEVYADEDKKSTVVFGSLDIVAGINPKLDYRLNKSETYATSEAAEQAKLNLLLKDIKDSGVASNFYYNVPIQHSSEIDLNPAIAEDKLSSPLSWYDPNNVNRKFVISEIDADYLSTGITLTKASRV